MANEKSHSLTRFRDMKEFRKILRMQSDNKRYKQFFGVEGCGLEIEFGVKYDMFSSRYTKTGLEKMRAAVGNRGKFVPDITIRNDFTVEIVLNPLSTSELHEVFDRITEILYCYDNFCFDENCGVHANFLADENVKESFYNLLLAGAYDSERFIHNKYKQNILDLACRTKTGAPMNYQEFYAYQNEVCGKYVSVNFLKKRLIEFRSLKLNWEDIDYVIGLYEAVSSPVAVDMPGVLNVVPDVLDETPAFVFEA